MMEPQRNSAVATMTTIRTETRAAVVPKLITAARFDQSPLRLEFRGQTCLP